MNQTGTAANYGTTYGAAASALEQPRPTVTSVLNDAYTDLNNLNGRLESVASLLRGPRPEAASVPKPAQGPMGTLNLAECIREAVKMAQGRLSEIEQTL